LIHELLHIVEKANQCFKKKELCVLATVVALDGTSYRKPGVRMLITRGGDMLGAVSGGCVEKDIAQRAQQVFKTGQALVMAYDGRFRLGCEGILYILIEPFEVNDELYNAFNKHLEKRQALELTSYFVKADNSTGAFGTQLILDEKTYQFNPNAPINSKLETLNSKLAPCFKLIIIGAEHDAVKLCSIAAKMGWEVEVVSTWRDPKTQADFPEAKNVISISPEMLEVDKIDQNTAVVLMTHSYALDLKYLMQLQNATLAYLGVLGSRHRNDQLRAELFEHTQSFDELEFYGPIGLNIGAETPEEIAISIISEILSVTRNKEQKSLSTHKSIIGI
jgi:xanthine/CO dehydrogenase XdhC/CoxF family maturation factor